MVEMLIVVVVIIILSAVAVPGLMQYFRNVTINGSIRSIATEIETARYGAIGKNVNLGVVFVVLSATEFRYVVEDDQNKITAPNWSILANTVWADLTGTLATEQAGGLRTLPPTMRFITCAASQTGGASPTAEIGFRFDRMGRPRRFADSGTWPADRPTPTAYVTMDSMGATICVQEAATARTAWLTVASGGRVRIQRAGGV